MEEKPSNPQSPAPKSGGRSTGCLVWFILALIGSFYLQVQKTPPGDYPELILVHLVILTAGLVTFAIIRAAKN